MVCLNTEKGQTDLQSKPSFVQVKLFCSLCLSSNRLQTSSSFCKMLWCDTCYVLAASQDNYALICLCRQSFRGGMKMCVYNILLSAWQGICWLSAHDLLCQSALLSTEHDFSHVLSAEWGHLQRKELLFKKSSLLFCCFCNLQTWKQNRFGAHTCSLETAHYKWTQLSQKGERANLMRNSKRVESICNVISDYIGGR